ncbi:hypothetical protein CRG98_034767 [Punica granatum]|uniref:Uncharacterized protein n=1 Tax=Punica granatum TaxID=22663 RepID=A0A2I0ILE3_PUNGR|nr:hypothetical protein CRG98_034767 [Punica granatum]
MRTITTQAEEHDSRTELEDYPETGTRAYPIEGTDLTAKTPEIDPHCKCPQKISSQEPHTNPAKRECGGFGARSDKDLRTTKQQAAALLLLFSL